MKINAENICDYTIVGGTGGGHHPKDDKTIEINKLIDSALDEYKNYMSSTYKIDLIALGKELKKDVKKIKMDCISVIHNQLWIIIGAVSIALTAIFVVFLIIHSLVF